MSDIYNLFNLDISGESILPEDWVNFSVSPTENSDHDTYGAHFWLRRRASASQNISEADPLTGMYFASGHDGLVCLSQLAVNTELKVFNKFILAIYEYNLWYDWLFRKFKASCKMANSINFNLLII